jgi:hypothetical protein
VSLPVCLPRPGRLLLVVSLVVALSASLVVPVQAAVDADAESEFITALNGERTRRGLPALTVCRELRDVARAHSRRMADANLLHHNPNLASDVKDWTRLAENVGRGGSVASLHRALMNSDGHRRNILDDRVSQLGIGVEVVGSTMWVTQVFRQPRSGAACSSTAPAPTVLAAPAPSAPEVRLEGDFTGDGSTDVAVFTPSDGRWRVGRSSGGRFLHATWDTFATRTGWSHHLVGDFDGDGRDDIASYHPGSGTWWVSRSTGESFVTQRWATFNTRTGWSHHLVGDFDGDGRDDIASYHPGAGTWWVSRSTGSRFRLEHWATFSTRTGWSHHLVGDFDGDGRDDIASYHPGAGTWWLSRATSTSYTASFVLIRWATFNTRTGWSDHLVGDVDGDGRDDIASYHPGAGTWWVSRSHGKGVAVEHWGTFNTRTGWSHGVGDANGDGRQDVISHHGGAGTWWVSHGTDRGFHLTQY